MKFGSCFSGAGLGDFGFEMAGLECAWQIENDKYCRKVLDLRWPEIKKYEDIKTVKGSELESVDVVVGGFPCQPFSVAGKRGGTKDDRFLWPQMLRIVETVKPRWIVAENVPGIIGLALDDVLLSLETAGYEARPIVFPAHALGAPHRRERVWIVAWNTAGQHFNKGAIGKKAKRENSESSRICKNVADNDSERLPHTFGGEAKSSSGQQFSGFRNWWKTEPAVGRVVDGCPHRVDRLRSLGNGQVPDCTFQIGKWILEIEHSG